MSNTYNLKEEQLLPIEMAIELKKPLLISGRPGAGKTNMSHSYQELENTLFNPVFQFNSKSNSIFTDLLYTYDAVGHFQSKNIDGEKNKTAADFIRLEALGKAIVLAYGIDKVKQRNGWGIIINKSLPDTDYKTKSIVLIDEVDKAPRDFPNDLLNELDNLEFTIKELDNGTISLKDTDLKENILIMLTSNDEKSLPDAFLRRCLFYYMDYPDKDVMVEILKEKLEQNNIKYPNNEWLTEKMNTYYSLLENTNYIKSPSTAECIDWVLWLSINNDKLKDSLNILFKNNMLVRNHTTVNDKI